MVNNISRANRSYYTGGSSSYTNPLADDMSTKGQCRTSEEKLVAKIKELAYRDAAAGKDSAHSVYFHGLKRATAEWRQLRADYISFASPDRAGIIQKKLAQLTGKSFSMGLKSNSRLEAFAILFGNNRSSNSRSNRIHDPDVGANYISFRDEHGREIAHYCTLSGWHFFDTPAESARRDEFYDLWNQALAEAQEALGQGQGTKEDIIFEARA